MKHKIEVAHIVRPMPGERVSGDTIAVQELENGWFIAIVDVLGHGKEAHEVAVMIDDFLSTHAGDDVIAIVQSLHQHIKGTRGAAATLCHVNSQTGETTFTGVGNTVLRLFGSREIRFDAREGVLGQNIRTPKLESLHLQARDILLFHSDGVQSRFNQMEYPQILCHDAETITRTIIKRFGKTHDDASCVCLIYHD